MILANDGGDQPAAADVGQKSGNRPVALLNVADRGHSSQNKFLATGKIGFFLVGAVICLT